MNGDELRLGLRARPYLSVKPPFEPSASLALDFTRQRYRNGLGSYAVSDFGSLANLTVSRSSVGYAETTSGTLVQFPANTARITDKGLLVEESRTKKNTEANLNPQNLTNITKSGDAASVLSVVDDSAALAAIGLTGNVYKLDNSAGVTSAFATPAGQTGNTNAHSVSAYIRGGTGYVGQTSGAGGSTFAASASYQRRKAESWTPALSTTQVTIRADAGQTVYFILLVLEEGAFVTSPIGQATAVSATRAADSVSVGGLSVGPPLTLLTDIEYPVVASAIVGGASISDGTTSNRLYHDTSSSNVVRANVVTAGATEANPQPAVTVTAGLVVRQASRFETNNVRSSANGALSALDSAAAMPAALSNLALGATSPVTAAVGARYIRRAVIYPRAFTDAELIAATQ